MSLIHLLLPKLCHSPSERLMKPGSGRFYSVHKIHWLCTGALHPCEGSSICCTS